MTARRLLLLVCALVCLTGTIPAASATGLRGAPAYRPDGWI
jgi:hypothetical protein